MSFLLDPLTNLFCYIRKTTVAKIDHEMITNTVFMYNGVTGLRWPSCHFHISPISSENAHHRDVKKVHDLSMHLETKIQYM